MTEADKTRLIKLLNLSSSTNDHEALSAVRFANALIKKSGTTWEKAFESSSVHFAAKGSTTGTKRDPFDHKKYRAPDDYPGFDGSVSVEEMLRVCLTKVYGDSREFIESLDSQFRRTRRLSMKQKYALRKFYENCKKGR